MTALPRTARSGGAASVSAVVVLSALLCLWLGMLSAQPAASQEDEAESAGTAEAVVPEPAVPAPEEPAGPPEPEWSYRFLVPASMVLGTAAVIGAIIMYFVRVTRNRYRVIE